MDQFGYAEPDGNDDERHQIGPGIEWLGSFSRAHRLLWNRLRLEFLPGDHIDADIARAPHQVVHHRTAPEFEPPGTCRLADDDLRHIIGVREADHVVGNAASNSGNGERLASQCLGQAQRIGKPVPLLIRQLQAPPGLDADGGPGRVQAIRQPLGVAHEPGRPRVLAEANQDALARRPGAGDRVRLHVREQLLVDALGRPPQCQLAQRSQIPRREIMLQRPFGLRGDVNLALFQPLNQIVRREVDELNRIGTIKDKVRNGLSDTHMRDLGDHIVETLDMLDIDRGVDVDAAGEQLLDVEVALRMATTRRVGVGEFIDQRDPRMARDQRVEIHFLDQLIPVLEAPARDDFKAVEKRLGFQASVCFDRPYNDIGAGLQLRPRIFQHRVGFADARGGAYENF